MNGDGWWREAMRLHRWLLRMEPTARRIDSDKNIEGFTDVSVAKHQRKGFLFSPCRPVSTAGSEVLGHRGKLELAAYQFQGLQKVKIQVGCQGFCRSHYCQPMMQKKILPFLPLSLLMFCNGIGSSRRSYTTLFVYLKWQTMSE